MDKHMLIKENMLLAQGVDTCKNGKKDLQRRMRKQCLFTASAICAQMFKERR